MVSWPPADCETERAWMPRDSHFDALSPHNLRVHLDPRGSSASTATASRLSAMTHASWFVLPPAEEYYYRRAHAEYRPLPPLRADCQGAGGRPALALLYPDANARVLIPRELDGQRGRTVFEAVAPAPGGHALLASRRPIPWAKRTLFTSNRWTSTPASTY